MNSDSDSDSSSASDDEIRRSPNPAANALAADFGSLARSPLPTSKTYSTPSRPSPSSSTPLNSPNFDPSSYTRTCLTTMSIEELLAIDDKLVSEVQDLDSTMQTLVYENYSKFIDATDAIRSIGKTVDKATEEMDRLLAVITEVDTGAKEVDSDLSSSRLLVASKVLVKRQLSRLGTLLSLPKTLKGLVAERRFKKAARAWVGARGVLSKAGQEFASLRKIEAECIDVISDLSKRLEATVRHLADETNPLPNPTPTPRFIIGMAEARAKLGGEEEEEEYVELAREAVRRDPVSHLDYISSLYRSYLEIFKDKYFKSVESFLPDSSTLLASSMKGLVSATSDLVVSLESGRGGKRYGRFKDWAYETVMKIMDRRVACRYRILREEVRDSLIKICTSPSPPSHKTFGVTVCTAIADLHHTAIMSLNSLKNLPIDTPMLALSVHGQARTFTLWVPSALESCAGLVGAGVVVGLGCDNIVGSKYEDDITQNNRTTRLAAVQEDPYDVDMTGLEKVGGGGGLALLFAEASRAGEDIVPQGATESLTELGGGDGTIDMDVDGDGACSLRFGMAGTRCLQVYVGDVGNECGEMVTLGLVNGSGGGNWGSGKREVREVREGVNMMLRRIKDISIELGAAFGEVSEVEEDEGVWGGGLEGLRGLGGGDFFLSI
ncbi:hypothetical protein TrCOL_g936 [Triparma columacea]|uniref:Vacuolar protein sorting-associated protein 51 homolog n=1 Tax=Triparma columacea TaxID=722753 RepID=A0A9W7GAL8_9STRA|nr:hypothetical protein TrCOL_g936 [Triparma columacea]